jgi:hypothetical protein
VPSIQIYTDINTHFRTIDTKSAVIDIGSGSIDTSMGNMYGFGYDLVSQSRITGYSNLPWNNGTSEL